MKVLSTEGLTKLIQLIKSTFIPASDTVSATTVTLADVATSGDIGDLTNVTLTTPSSGQVLSYDGSKWVNSSTGAGVTDVEVNGTSVVSGGVASVTVPTQASDINALPDSTKYGADLDLTGGTLQLLDQDGNALGNSVTVPDTSDFVQKTGDTMTGELIVEDNPVTIKNTTFDSSTSTSSYVDVGRFGVKDANGNFTAYFASEFNANDMAQATVCARRIINGTTKSAYIISQVDSSGNARSKLPTAHIDDNVSIVDKEVTKGTNPSSTSYSQILFNDKTDSDTWENTRLGNVYHVLGTDGTSAMHLTTYRNQAGSTASADINVSINSSGTASCSFPNTVRCDGQWVESTSQPGDSVNMNASTNVTYTLTQIPNDGHKYMVLVIASPVTGSTSGNQVLAQVTSTICQGGINVCRAQTRTNSTMAATGAAWIPVGSDRKITLNRSTSYTGTCNLYVRGYRRIGDNG